MKELYIKGKRNGEGKEYDDTGKLIFEGEYYNNYNLRGKTYIKEKLEYEGEYLFNNKKYDKDMINLEI